MISKRPVKDYLSVCAKAAGLSFLFFILTLDNYFGMAVIVFFTFLATVIYLVLKVFIWNHTDYWTFDGTTLIRGKNSNLSISLSEIEALRIGLPELTGWLEFILKQDSRENYNRRQSRAEETILIYLENSQVLPLGLKGFINSESFTLYFLLSFIKSKYPSNDTISKLSEIAKVAKNEIEYEQLVEKQNLDIKSIESLWCNLERRHILKKVGDSFSSNERKKLVYSKLNKIVQL